VITINFIIGNIHKENKLLEKYREMTNRQLSEVIKISRMEAQRVRMRKLSDKGSDVVLMLPQNTHLKHGDVLMLNEDKVIVLEIEPEKVAVIQVKDETSNHDHQHYHHSVEIPVKIGHTIGNLHRPIKLEANKIFFPIQAESELDLLRRLFGPIKEHLDITSTTMVFEPEEGTEIHEH
jgi:urease accessory protein